jgi:hypothetical protein
VDRHRESVRGEVADDRRADPLGATGHKRNLSVCHRRNRLP